MKLYDIAFLLKSDIELYFAAVLNHERKTALEVMVDNLIFIREDVRLISSIYSFINVEVRLRKLFFISITYIPGARQEFNGIVTKLFPLELFIF